MDDKENNKTMLHSSRLRKAEYRALIDNIEEIEESGDLGLKTIQNVTDIVEEANVLHDQCDAVDRVKLCDETLLDYTVLSNATNVLVKCAKAIDLNSSPYDPQEFSQMLISHITPEDRDEVEPADFLKLLETARAIIPETIKLPFLHGAHDLAKPTPQPKARKQREKPQMAEKKQPQLLDVVNSQEDGEDDDLVKYLYSMLREEYRKNGNKPLNYYKFVIDTSDFGSTVNNIFYCSFLIRDGKAAILLDDETLMISPVDKKEMKAFRENEGANTQIITSIDMTFWKKFTEEGYVQKHRKQKNRESLH